MFWFCFGVWFLGWIWFLTGTGSMGTLGARASQGGAGAGIRAHRRTPQCTSTLPLWQQAEKLLCCHVQRNPKILKRNLDLQMHWVELIVHTMHLERHRSVTPREIPVGSGLQWSSSKTANCFFGRNTTIELNTSQCYISQHTPCLPVISTGRQTTALIPKIRSKTISYRGWSEQISKSKGYTITITDI